MEKVSKKEHISCYMRVYTRGTNVLKIRFDSTKMHRVIVEIRGGAMVARVPVKHWVVGSNPTPGAEE